MNGVEGVGLEVVLQVVDILNEVPVEELDGVLRGMGQDALDLLVANYHEVQGHISPAVGNALVPILRELGANHESSSESDLSSIVIIDNRSTENSSNSEASSYSLFSVEGHSQNSSNFSSSNGSNGDGPSHRTRLQTGHINRVNYKGM